MLKISHTGDVHLEEDRYFDDTAHCLEWFVADSISAGADLFVIDGDLTTYKATIKERNFWIDQLVEMANHSPVILVAGNHGRELDGDLYVYARAKGRYAIHLCTEPAFIEFGEAGIVVYPYPRRIEKTGSDQNGGEAFDSKLGEFNQRFNERPGMYKLFFGHFGVAGARMSSGQPLIGRCAEFPLDPLRNLNAQYVGLSHIHLQQQLGPRIWYAGSLSRCDYSEVEEKGYNLVTLKSPGLRPDLSDLDVEFRVSPTRSMIELHAVFENGEFQLPAHLDTATLKGSRVKVVVKVPNGPDGLMSREQQENLRESLLAASPAELKVKFERDTDVHMEPAPIAAAKSAEEKLRAYWAVKGFPAPEIQQRLLAKLTEVEKVVLSDRQS